MVRLFLVTAIFFFLIEGMLVLKEWRAERKNESRPKPLETEHQKTLKLIASNEHELGLLPHNDSWVLEACEKCRLDKQASVAKENRLKELEANRRRDEAKWLYHVARSPGGAPTNEAIRDALILKLQDSEMDSTIVYADNIAIRTIKNYRGVILDEDLPEETCGWQNEKKSRDLRMDDYPIRVEGELMSRQDLEMQWLDYKDRGGTLEELPEGQLKELAKGIEARLEK